MGEKCADGAVKVQGVIVVVAKQLVGGLVTVKRVEGADLARGGAHATHEAAEVADGDLATALVVGEPGALLVEPCDVGVPRLERGKRGRAVGRGRGGGAGDRLLLDDLEIAVAREAAVRLLGGVRDVGEGLLLEEGAGGVGHHGAKVVVVGAGDVGAAGGLVEGERGVVGIDQAELVDVAGIGDRQVVRQALGPGLLGTRDGRVVLAHRPLVGGVGRVEGRGRAPAGGAEDGVGQVVALGVVRGGADLGKVRVVCLGVAGGGHDLGELAGAREAERDDALHVARQLGRVVAQVADGGLEVGHAPGRPSREELVAHAVVAVVAAAKAGVDVDEARVEVGRQAVVGVGGGGRLAGVGAGVQRHDDGGRLGREVADLALVVNLAGVLRPVLLALEVGAGNVDGNLLVGLGRGAEAVGDASLPPDLVVLVVLPGAHVDGELLELLEVDLLARRGGLGGGGGVLAVAAGGEHGRAAAGGQGEEASSGAVDRHADSRSSLSRPSIFHLAYVSGVQHRRHRTSGHEFFRASCGRRPTSHPARPRRGTAGDGRARWQGRGGGGRSTST